MLLKFSQKKSYLVFYVFSLGCVVLYAVFVVFPLPQTPGQNPGQKTIQKPIQKSLGNSTSGGDG